VARLKTQMTQKDKRLGQLKDAIKELEKKLVSAMQQAADNVMKGADVRMSENEHHKVGPDRSCSPRHRMTSESINEG
jgi:hypothetical protein